jgi:hypothetical protein
MLAQMYDPAAGTSSGTAVAAAAAAYDSSQQLRMHAVMLFACSMLPLLHGSCCLL